MADYRVKVMRDGKPARGAKVVAGEVLYAAATGADGVAKEFDVEMSAQLAIDSGQKIPVE